MAALIVGCVIGMTNMLAPIHETCHVLSAWSEGTGARITGWSSAELDRPNEHALRAGWFGEMWVFGGLAVLFALWGRGRFPHFTGGFPVGYMLSTWVRGYGSDDFTKGLQGFIDSGHGLSDGAAASVYEAASKSLTGAWTSLCAVLFLAAVSIVLMGLFKKKARGGRAWKAIQW